MGRGGDAPVEDLALDLFQGVGHVENLVAIVHHNAHGQQLDPPVGVQGKGAKQGGQAQKGADDQGAHVFDVRLVQGKGVDSLFGAVGGVGKEHVAQDGLVVAVLLVVGGQLVGQAGLQLLVPLALDGEVHRGDQDDQHQQHQQGDGGDNVRGVHGGLGLGEDFGELHALYNAQQQVLLLLGDALLPAVDVKGQGKAVDDGAVNQLVIPCLLVGPVNADAVEGLAVHIQVVLIHGDFIGLGLHDGV